MAYQRWSFDCREGCHLITPHCTRCGRDGAYAGWSLSTVEMMCQYHSFYRWAPCGEHRKIADKIMKPVTGICPECNGSGIHADPCDRGFDRCANCRATGRVQLCSDEEFERRRQDVIARTGIFKGKKQAVTEGGTA